jgi:hypothetical protein
MVPIITIRLFILGQLACAGRVLALAFDGSVHQLVTQRHDDIDMLLILRGELLALECRKGILFLVGPKAFVHIPVPHRVNIRSVPTAIFSGEGVVPFGSRLGDALNHLKRTLIEKRINPELNDMVGEREDVHVEHTGFIEAIDCYNF